MIREYHILPEMWFWNCILFSKIFIVPAILLYFLRRYINGEKCHCTTKILGKVVVVTGVTSGIGKETVKILSCYKAHLILGCRNMQAGEALKAELISKTGNKNIDIFHLDLSSFRSVEDFARNIHKKFNRIDILINNAAAFYLNPSETVDGYESVMQINYIAPFYLTHLLMDLVLSAPIARIINVSSHGYKMASSVSEDDFYLNARSYKKFITYAKSKLAMNLASLHLNTTLKEYNVTVNLLTPGNVDTSIYRNFPLNMGILGILLWPLRKIFYKSSFYGAQTIVHLALSESLQKVSGKYFNDCKVETLLKISTDSKASSELFNATTKLLQIEKFYEQNKYKNKF